MNLAAIAEYLETEGVGEQGKTIFVNNMPASCSAGILLRQPFGGSAIDYELPGYRKTSFMLIARATTYEAAKALIEAASAVLTIASPTALTGMRVNYSRPRHDPFTYPPSPGGLTEFVVNVDACFVIV